MLLFATMFVFNNLAILQGNYAEEISDRPGMTFSCKQNRKSKRQCLLAILLILMWGLKERSQQNKGTLILGVEAPAAH